MTPHSYVIGIDYGTGSARALLVDAASGEPVASAEVELETLVSNQEPELARQRPADYLEALEAVICAVLTDARARRPGFEPDRVLGLGVDATGSTPLPVDDANCALGCIPEFRENLNAQAWLWKDHTASVEAAAISETAADWPQPYLQSCGGAYSSEWFWAKIWRCLKEDRAVFEAAYSWVECCDWLASQLAGIEDPAQIRRGACAAGHKALYSQQWGGLPDAGFLGGLAPELAELRERLFDHVYPIGDVAGQLSDEWAGRTGLMPGIAISVANLDAHSGAVGAGVGEGQLVKIMGTSTCDCALLPGENAPDIAGISGVAADSIVPGYFGVEAGQSAVGDIFAWFVDKVCQGESDLHRVLSEEMASLRAGESGLVALDWHNGNRCVLADPELSGHLFGLTLHSSRAEIYRTWVEATAFGARMILDTLAASGVGTDTIICCGGIAAKNPVLMKIYADITGCILKVSDSDQACALGAAIAAAVAAGIYSDVPSAQAALAARPSASYVPCGDEAAVYDELYAIYGRLHNALGRGQEMDLNRELTRLRQISREQRQKA